MESHDTIIDNVKIEKAKAMMRYNRIRNIAKMFRAVEFFAALSLLSWSSTRLPNALTISTHYFLNLLKPHVVFVIGNAIIAGIYFLSRQKTASGNHGTAAFPEESVRQEVEIPSETASAFGGETPDTAAPATKAEAECDEKRIVAVASGEAQIKCDAVQEAIMRATKEIRRFERTQSVKLKRELGVKPRAELRRSESESRRRNLPSGDNLAVTTSFRTVEHLSSEEFRRTIEAFIDQQKLMWSPKLGNKSTIGIN